MRGHVEASAEGTGVSGGSEALAAAQARIAELEAATAALEQQQRVQAALYRIAETANAARDLQDFYASIHEIVAGSCTARTSTSRCTTDEREMINFPVLPGQRRRGHSRPGCLGAVRDRQRERADRVRPADRPAAARAGRTVHSALVAEGEVAEVGAGGRGLARGSAPLRRRTARCPRRADLRGRPALHRRRRSRAHLRRPARRLGAEQRSRIGRGAPARRRARDRERGGPGPGATARLPVDHGGGRPAGGRGAGGATGCRSPCSIRRSARPGSCTGSPKACGRTELEGIVLDDVLTARILEIRPADPGRDRPRRPHAIGAPFKVDGTESYLGRADPGRRQGHRRDRDRHGRRHAYGDDARAPALDAGDEHGCRPRQRPAVRGNEAPPRGGRRAGCRARDRQPHRQRPRPPARSRLADRARRRADAQRVPRGHRVRRAARRGDAR